MSPALLQQLTLAILDGSPDEGHRVITTIRSRLDTWEIFVQDRQQLRDHLVTAHHAGSLCLEADPASLNRQHWQAHGSDLASFMAGRPPGPGVPAAAIQRRRMGHPAVGGRETCRPSTTMRQCPKEAGGARS